MPSKSTSSARGGRADSFLPNAHAHLRLLAVQLVAKDRAPMESSMEILGWVVRDDRSIPITVFGVHEPSEGWHYAILNTLDKSHVDLSDGRQYMSYAAFMEPKWRAFEQAPAAEPEAKPAPSTREPRSSSDPEPWKEVRK